MYDMCINNFLEKSRPSYVERHSDSSEFENSCSTAVTRVKVGRPSLLKIKTRKKPKKDIFYDLIHPVHKNVQLYSANLQHNRSIPSRKIYIRRKVLSCDKYVDCSSSYNAIQNIRQRGYNNRDETSYSGEKCSNLQLRNNSLLSTTTLLYTNDNHQRNNIENMNYENTYSSYNERRRDKRFNKRRKDYLIQPVNTVAKILLSFPIQGINDYVQLSQIDAIGRNYSDNNYDYSLSSDFEEEEIKPHNKINKKLVRYIMNRLEKRIKKGFPNVETIKNEEQQYPSKFQIKSPCQTFGTLCCQTKSVCTDSEDDSKILSSSSEFWDFVLQKIKYQIHQAEVTKTKAVNSMKSCNKDICHFKAVHSNTNKPKPQSKCSEQIPENDEPKCCRNIDQVSKDYIPNKLTQNSQLFCKCTNQHEKSKKLPTDVKPCQDPHSALTKQLGDKYKAEILCIHNPPCVLINGCLNLPPPESSTPKGRHFYPVTQSKMSSFVQMCSRKMKRSKHKTIDQANQCHSLKRSVDLQEYLPEFKTEKIIQSVCNHNPPCEIVRVCHKPRYNPASPTSCVHVPMCPRIPECLFDQQNIDEKTCNHTPKCAELPLCTRKYTVLTTKEHVSTQVKPKSKVGCLHQPPCLMIPKCLAQAICGDWLPGNNIPGCVHQPSCEMVPACCRKKIKESVITYASIF